MSTPPVPDTCMEVVVEREELKDQPACVELHDDDHILRERKF